MIEIRATDAGFHLETALGAPMAPPVFLRSAANPMGTLLLTEPGTAWVSRDSLESAHLRVTATSTEPLDPGAPGGSADVAITRLDFFRVTEDGPVPIGSIAFDDPLVMRASIDPAAAAGAPAWRGDFGAVFEDALQAEGFRFLGGAGADVFAPEFPVLPIYGPVEILGRGGDDLLEGSYADDLIRGGAGDDRIFDLSGQNALYGGSGDDVLELGVWSVASDARGGAGDDRLVSSNGADALRGNGGTDRLEGGRGDDRLAGGSGNDELDGGEGADALRGGLGDDLLTGGAGADRFVFRADQAGRDTITDFDPAEDELRFAGGVPDDLESGQDGGSLQLSWNGGDSSITLVGIGPDDLWALPDLL